MILCDLAHKCLVQLRFCHILLLPTFHILVLLILACYCNNLSGLLFIVTSNITMLIIVKKMNAQF